MACGVSRNFVRLLFGLILLTFGTFANAACVINAENGTSDTDSDSALSIVLKEGAQRLSLSCDVNATHVLYFPRNYLSYNQLYDSEASIFGY